MPKNKDCIAIYSRKSRFTGKGESIGNQVELCKEYIRSHYGESALQSIIIFEDEGFSGGNLNRPDFKRMMKSAQERQFKSIIVYRLDRISRNISDFSGLIEDLSKLDIAFVSIKEQFDTGSPMGRAMMYIASVFSQLERETIAERIRDNMHELAKTGRWLGGTTPTGYASESVKSITMDGKAKKACKLKSIPEEAAIVRTIYEKFIESTSLTATETELLQLGIKSKNGKYYTRFSIKAILQNPVYMIADQDTYDYFVEMNADLFSNREAFDGTHGIMAYNRTDQEKGRATIYRPIHEWIVSVGDHAGLIPGKLWIAVQKSLERNKSKSYRKARNNEALLTGLLFCKCGNRMYPKLSKRTTADGKPIYTYVCKMKERSQRTLCNGKNANGNTLDAAIIEEIKQLEDDNPTFLHQLENSRQFYTGSRAEYEKQLSTLRKEKAELAKKMEALIDSLADAGDSMVKTQIFKRIEQLSQEDLALLSRIQELESLTSQETLNTSEFDLMKELLSLFKSSIDQMSVEQQRAALRTVVRKVIWDGVYAHVVLFGSSEEEIAYPEFLTLTSDDEETEPFSGFPPMVPKDKKQEETPENSIETTDNHADVKTHWESIANEILMYFRGQRKYQGDLSLSDSIDSDSEGNALSLMDVIRVDDDLLENLDAKDSSLRVRRCVTECLSQREANIITLRYGLDGEEPRTQREIAAACGISRSYVSRIEKKALQKLKEELDKG